MKIAAFIFGIRRLLLSSAPLASPQALQRASQRPREAELQPRELNDTESGVHGGLIPGWRGMSTPAINRISTFPPSIFRRCPVANTNIAAAITTVSLFCEHYEHVPSERMLGIPLVSGAENRSALI
jgi:hypothetical protein